MADNITHYTNDYWPPSLTRSRQTTAKALLLLVRYCLFCCVLRSSVQRVHASMSAPFLHSSSTQHIPVQTKLRNLPVWPPGQRKLPVRGLCFGFRGSYIDCSLLLSHSPLMLIVAKLSREGSYYVGKESTET